MQNSHKGETNRIEHLTFNARLHQSVCQLFRSSKSAKSLLLSINRKDSIDQLVFEFQLTNGITRKHYINSQEADVLNAVFEEDSLCSKITIRPAVMLQLLEHFRSRSSELLLRLNRHKFAVRSYLSPEAQLTQLHSAHTTSTVSGHSHMSREEKRFGGRPTMNTDISLNIEELESFDFRNNVDRSSDDSVAGQDDVFLFSAKEVR